MGQRFLLRCCVMLKNTLGGYGFPGAQTTWENWLRILWRINGNNFKKRYRAIHGVTKSWTRLSDWTELNWRVLSTETGTCDSKILKVERAGKSPGSLEAIAGPRAQVERKRSPAVGLQTTLGSTGPHAVKPICWPWVVEKESKALTAGCQARSPGR